MLAAHRASAFIATVTGAAAVSADNRADIDIISFNFQWHSTNIASQPTQ